MRLSRLAFVPALALLLSSATAARAQQDGPPARGDRDAARVASTERFAFHSDFWFNLHDFLHWRAQRNGPAEAGADCIAGLPETERAGWERADAHYREHTEGRDARTDELLRSIRFDITGLPTDEPVHTERAGIYELLEGAAPAYRACFWREHDARNRKWIDNAVTLLREHEAAAVHRLEQVYRDPWPEHVPVDIVGYSNWAGANTTGRPLHILMSATDADIGGPSSLEMILHEASHGVLGPGFGTVTEALDAALREHGLRATRDHWHAVLFYTAGSIARDLLRSGGYPDYELYMKRGRGVYGQLLPALEAHWAPYLEGEIDLATAAERYAEAAAAAR